MFAESKDGKEKQSGETKDEKKNRGNRRSLPGTKKKEVRPEEKKMKGEIYPRGHEKIQNT